VRRVVRWWRAILGPRGVRGLELVDALAYAALGARLARLEPFSELAPEGRRWIAEVHAGASSTSDWREMLMHARTVGDRM